MSPIDGARRATAVLDRDECITLASVEPRHAVAAVAQRPGARHPITVGAPSKAILATLDPAEWPTAVDDRLRADIKDLEQQSAAPCELCGGFELTGCPLVIAGTQGDPRFECAESTSVCCAEQGVVFPEKPAHVLPAAVLPQALEVTEPNGFSAVAERKERTLAAGSHF